MFFLIHGTTYIQLKMKFKCILFQVEGFRVYNHFV